MNLDASHGILTGSCFFVPWLTHTPILTLSIIVIHPGKLQGSSKGDSGMTNLEQGVTRTRIVLVCTSLSSELK